MTVKSIVEIEIKDGAWRSFNEQVKQHQAELKKMPGQWGAVGKSIASGQSAAAKFTATIKEQAKQFKEANGAAAKMTLSIKAADRVATSLARNTFKIAMNLKDATKSLLSWGSVMGLISGVLGAGGLFGIARMASSVSSGQSSAMRSGSGYGENKAAGIAYGQLLGGAGGVESLLNRMAQEKESGGIMFRRLGLNEGQWKNQSPAELLGPFLSAIQQAYKNAPKGAEAKVMGTLAPELDFNTIKQLSQTNLQTLRATYESSKRQLDLSRNTQNAWANFDRALQNAGEKLENTFVKSLVPLAPALTKFAEGLNKAVALVMNSPMVKNLISGSGRMMEKGAAYLTGEGFSNDFKSFIAEMRKVAAAMHDTAEFLHKWLGESNDQTLMRSRDEYNSGNARQFAPGEAKSLINQIPENVRSNSTVTVKVDINNAAGANVNASAYAGAAR